VDALSDVLSAVRLTSGAFLDAEFTAPWCVTAQVGPEDCRPAGPLPAHIIAYHYVVTGRLVLMVQGMSPVYVAAGEIVLLSRNDRHALGSAPGLPPEVIDHLVQVPDHPGSPTLRYGGGGEVTRIICGFLGCEVPDNPLIDTLPTVLQFRLDEDGTGTWIAESFHRAVHEFGVGGIGSATVLGRLAELLFIEAVRRYMATLPPGQTGWLAGLRDRSVGRALALVHRQPGREWTAGELASQVGLSRSAFAERFVRLIDMPPMRYLTWWRLQLAASRLREGSRSTAQIAEEVGYGSEAALGRAFKSHFGVTLATWRRRR